MNCPNCGALMQQLVPQNYSDDTPPWLCSNCSRGWWNAELTVKARQNWNPLTRSHDKGSKLVEIRTEAEAERQDRKKNK